MKFLRVLLFPISIIYGLITYIRNLLFNYNILKSTKFNLPVISMGNLSVGGTGKSPHIEYLIRLLKTKHQVATLSRGYKRDTNGFYIADNFSNSKDIGDEPMQFKHKFPKVIVAVDKNRVNGINELLKNRIKPKVVLLDDAFQHRRVQPGFQVILTPYDDLYSSDFMLPTGSLREFSFGSKRANIIIVTKCPNKLTKNERKKISSKLKIEKNQKLLFSKIVYDKNIYGVDNKMEFDKLKDYKVLLVTGIANPKPLIKLLKNYDIIFKHIKFVDHHDFSDHDISLIDSEFVNLGSGKKIILTTEKDYVRLIATNIHKSSLMYLPISVDFLNGDKSIFDNKILDYVKQN